MTVPLSMVFCLYALIRQVGTIKNAHVILLEEEELTEEVRKYPVRCGIGRKKL